VTGLPWLRVLCADGNIHVVPDEDLREHRQYSCWCHPVPDVECDDVIVHNALDRREVHEQGAPLH